MVDEVEISGVEKESVDDDALSDLFNDDFYSSSKPKEKPEGSADSKEDFNPYKDLDNEEPEKKETKTETSTISKSDLDSLRGSTDEKINKLTEGMGRLSDAVTKLIETKSSEPGVREEKVSDAVRAAQEKINQMIESNPENKKNIEALQTWLDSIITLASNGKNTSLADLIQKQGNSETVSRQVSELSNKLETKEIKEAFEALGSDPDFNIPGEYYSGKVFRDVHLFPLIAEEKAKGIKDGISATIYKRMKAGESPREVMDYLYSKALTNYRREASKKPDFLNNDPVLKAALIAEKKRMHSNPGGTADPYKGDFTGKSESSGKRASEEDRILDFMGEMAFNKL